MKTEIPILKMLPNRVRRNYLGCDYGKFEAYYVLGIREDVKEPYIRLGFQRKDITKRNLEENSRNTGYRRNGFLFRKDEFISSFIHAISNSSEEYEYAKEILRSNFPEVIASDISHSREKQ